MDKETQSIKRLNELCKKIPDLKRLNHRNQEYPLWTDNIKDTLEAGFGENSIEYKRFTAIKHIYYSGLATEEERQAIYLQDLEVDERNIKSILERQEIIKISTFKCITKWLKSPLNRVYYESRDFIATVIAKYLKEKTN
jgi:hypothetical protein